MRVGPTEEEVIAAAIELVTAHASLPWRDLDISVRFGNLHFYKSGILIWSLVEKYQSGRLPIQDSDQEQDR